MRREIPGWLDVGTGDGSWCVPGGTREDLPRVIQGAPGNQEEACDQGRPELPAFQQAGPLESVQRNLGEFALLGLGCRHLRHRFGSGNSR